MSVPGGSGAVEGGPMGGTQVASLNVEPLIRALHSTQKLRANINSLFEQLSSGVKVSGGSSHTEQQDRDKEFLGEIREGLTNINSEVEELDKLAQSIPNQYTPISMGNPAFLSLDPLIDKSPLHAQITQTYKWSNKVQTQSGLGHQLLLNGISKRSYLTSPFGKRLRRNLTGPVWQNHQQYEAYIQNMVKFGGSQDLSVSVSKTYGSLTVLLVSVGRVMKVAVVMRGLMVEWITCRAFHEEIQADTDKFDMRTQSRYAVFQKISSHARCAMMYYSSVSSEPIIRSVMLWLHSYRTLFTTPCTRCDKLLSDFTPPTFRDFRSYEPYHEQCRR